MKNLENILKGIMVDCCAKGNIDIDYSDLVHLANHIAENGVTLEEKDTDQERIVQLERENAELAKKVDEVNETNKSLYAQVLGFKEERVEAENEL